MKLIGVSLDFCLVDILHGKTSRGGSISIEDVLYIKCGIGTARPIRGIDDMDFWKGHIEETSHIFKRWDPTRNLEILEIIKSLIQTNRLDFPQLAGHRAPWPQQNFPVKDWQYGYHWTNLQGILKNGWN